MSLQQLRNSVRKAQEAFGITPVLATSEQLDELAEIRKQIATITKGLQRLGVMPDVAKQERDREAKLSEVNRKLAKHESEKASRPCFQFTKLAEDREFERKMRAEAAAARGDCTWWSGQPA